MTARVETSTVQGSWIRRVVFDAHSWWAYALVVCGLLLAAGAIELRMGRVPWCTCGYIKLWHGVVASSENSQHLTDWYTFTHLLHGIGFYVLLWVAARRLPPGTRFMAAVLLEAAWEVVENSPFIIERYRAATISLDYYGDSVINSLSDIATMMIGYGFAKIAPVWTAIALFVAIEVVLALAIRDNLTLNVLMLIHPFDAIKHWQLAQ